MTVRDVASYWVLFLFPNVLLIAVFCTYSFSSKSCLPPDFNPSRMTINLVDDIRRHDIFVMLLHNNDHYK